MKESNSQNSNEKMFRSISTSRVSDDTYYSIYNHSPTSKAVSPALRALALEANELPQYETWSFPTTPKKKKLGRARMSEKAVHLIPLVLLFCALVLWFFSNPEINMPIKNDMIGGKIKRKAVERNFDRSTTIHIESSHADALGISKQGDGKKLAMKLLRGCLGFRFEGDYLIIASKKPANNQSAYMCFLAFFKRT